MEKGTFCLKVMPFGLKNIGATYLLIVIKIFEGLIQRILKVFIEDTTLEPEDFI